MDADNKSEGDFGFEHVDRVEEQLEGMQQSQFHQQDILGDRDIKIGALDNNFKDVAEEITSLRAQNVQFRAEVKTVKSKMDLLQAQNEELQANNQKMVAKLKAVELKSKKLVRKRVDKMVEAKVNELTVKLEEKHDKFMETIEQKFGEQLTQQLTAVDTRPAKWWKKAINFRRKIAMRSAVSQTLTVNSDIRKDGGSEEHSLLVSITEGLSKPDNKTEYTIRTKTTFPEYVKREMSVVREHEKFVWLHKCLKECEQYAGFIIPPAPPRHDFGSSTKKLRHLGEVGAIMPKEEYEKMKKELEREYLVQFKETVAQHEAFLYRLAAHPIFRKDPNFRIFLENEGEVLSLS